MKSVFISLFLIVVFARPVLAQGFNDCSRTCSPVCVARAEQLKSTAQDYLDSCSGQQGEIVDA